MAARDDTPSIQEIAELTARLRRLSVAGPGADQAEQEAFLADKDALIARIEAANRETAERQIPAEMPVEMVNGIEERRTGPAEVDDPAELQARLDELRQRNATGQGVGSKADAEDVQAAELADRVQRDHWAAEDADGDDFSREW